MDRLFSSAVMGVLPKEEPLALLAMLESISKNYICDPPCNYGIIYKERSGNDRYDFK